jgi:tetratricopeptide (TPR) repeat protein
MAKPMRRPSVPIAADIELERAIADVLRDADTWAGDPPSEPMTAAAIVRLAGDVRDEKVDAAKLYSEWRTISASRSWLAAAADQRFRTPSFVSELAIVGRQIREDTPSVALDLHEQAVFLSKWLAPSVRSAVATGNAYRELANTLLTVNRYPEALQAADHATCAYAGVPGEDYFCAVVDLVRCVIYTMSRESLDRARILLTRSAVVVKGYGDHRRHIDAKIAEGYLLYAEKQYGDAREVWESVRREAEETGQLESLARIYNNLGAAWRELGERDRAAKCLEAAMVLFSELRMNTEAPRVRWGLARLERDRKRWLESLKLYRQAQKDFMANGQPRAASMIALELVELLLLLGDPEGAALEAAPLPQHFIHSGMPSRAVEAANYVRQATKARTATPAKIRQTREYVNELTAHPDLPFHLPQEDD